MIKLTDIIQENSQSTYDYGCVMLYFNFPSLNRIHDAINPNHIYEEEGDKTYGLEDEPHTTLLYGLHKEVTLKDVTEVLNKYEYSACEIYNPSLFVNEKYDVLKFDVKGKNLQETNKALREYPHTTNYPKYHPHLTIGYIVSGYGQKYVNMLNKADARYSLTPQYAIYSRPDGTKLKIEIKVV